MRASDTGLSTTTTSSGLFEDARTRPQVPSSTVTRTPLTVTRSRMFWPAIFSCFSRAAWKCFTTSSTTRYLISSSQYGDIVGDCQVLGRAFFSCAIDVPGFLETGDRADFVDTAFDVGMTGLPVIGLGTVFLQNRIGREQAGRFHVGHEGRARVQAGNVARE